MRKRSDKKSVCEQKNISLSKRMQLRQSDNRRHGANDAFHLVLILRLSTEFIITEHIFKHT